MKRKERRFRTQLFRAITACSDPKYKDLRPYISIVLNLIEGQETKLLGWNAKAAEIEREIIRLAKKIETGATSHKGTQHPKHTKGL